MIKPNLSGDLMKSIKYTQPNNNDSAFSKCLFFENHCHGEIMLIDLLKAALLPCMEITCRTSFQSGRVQSIYGHFFSTVDYLEYHPQPNRIHDIHCILNAR